MLPETCRVVIPIKLEFSASVGFIHKESFLLCLLISLLHSVDMRVSGNTVIVRRILKGNYFRKIVLVKAKQRENYDILSNDPFTSR